MILLVRVNILTLWGEAVSCQNHHFTLIYHLECIRVLKFTQSEHSIEILSRFVTSTPFDGKKSGLSQARRKYKYKSSQVQRARPSRQTKQINLWLSPQQAQRIRKFSLWPPGRCPALR